jgi:hypothetical protein
MQDSSTANTVRNAVITVSPSRGRFVLEFLFDGAVAKQAT